MENPIKDLLVDNFFHLCWIIGDLLHMKATLH